LSSPILQYALMSASPRVVGQKDMDASSFVAYLRNSTHNQTINTLIAAVQP
jgi:hypothetical protein